jgi:tRNA(Arg) A34 adenosine deaminase TadA
MSGEPEGNEPDAVVITVPAWVDTIAAAGALIETDEARMALVVRLAGRNVEEGGGPFAAAVFEGSRLMAAGVNRVLESGLSIAHGEIVALMRAQQLARDLARPAATRQLTGPYTLVTSTEPCCQCFGALIWSGATRLVCGATTADAEAIGFDEGPKPERWPEVLEKRGITVALEICRDQAKAVLDEYARRGGAIYGLRHPTIE